MTDQKNPKTPDATGPKRSAESQCAGLLAAVGPESTPPAEAEVSEDGHLQYLLTAYLFENISEAGRLEVDAHVHAARARVRQIDRFQVCRDRPSWLPGILYDSIRCRLHYRCGSSHG